MRGRKRRKRGVPLRDGTIVMIVDPILEKTRNLAAKLLDRGYSVISCSTLYEAMETAQIIRPSYVITELRFPDGMGSDFVRWMAHTVPETRTVVHTWFASISTAVSLAKAGAEDFVPKPTDEEFLVNILLFGSGNIPKDCSIKQPDNVCREHVEHVLRLTRSNISEAARKLNLHRRSLQRMIRRFEQSPLLVDEWPTGPT